jgi:hypothetical protein
LAVINDIDRLAVINDIDRLAVIYQNEESHVCVRIK